MNTLEKEFVPYEQALELKALGFDEPCFGLFIRDKSLLVKEMPNQNECEIYFGGILAPTFSQAFRWFRDKHNLKDKYGVFPHHTIMFNYIIGGGKEEEAELACLRKLIEIVKQNL